MFSFRLSDDFLAPFKDREPEWGYRDAAGNAVGEITFLRTYSRIKEDGSKERWWEVCRRVIEGMYSIQKDHCKSNRLPWNDNRAAASAHEAYHRMFEFKWLPPGRGLWMMGSPLVNRDRNSAALQNCLDPKSTVLTAEGVRCIGDFVEGEGVLLWSPTKGEWVKGVKHSYGERHVQRITFRPLTSSRHRVEVVATPDHRWVLADGTVTDGLRVGHRVLGGVAQVDTESPEYRQGWMHGVVFGDGSRHSGKHPNRYRLQLCGVKGGWADTFRHHPGFVSITSDSRRGDPVVTLVSKSGEDLKSVPHEGATAEYVAGFVRGYVDADGYQERADQFSLSSRDPKAVEYVVRNAGLAGYTVTGGRTPHIDKSSFSRRTRYEVRLSRGAIEWQAVEIVDAGQTEVACFTVDDTQDFTLSSGIGTGNCGFVSTANMPKHDPAKPLAWLMEASMLGIGIGFDTKGADKGFTIYQPGAVEKGKGAVVAETIVIPDTREGWVESVRRLINSYLRPNQAPVEFDYSEIRPAGSPIKTFGGTAAGPEPLRRGHDMIRALFDGREGELLTSTDIADIGNILGVVVVSGNVRRSAELLMGSLDDPDFLNLKNSEVMPDRQGWAWMSNNSVEVTADTDLSPIIEGIKLNGEPGVIWMDVTRDYGRLIDPPDGKDWRAAGYNPCAEQPLESYELCTLAEVFPTRHENKADFLRSLKFAYLYGKTVTLLPTHWDETNAVMQRNRRIGTSVSGLADFSDEQGLLTLREWLNDGYGEIRKWDHIYSEWLAIRESIRVTTVKPSGTVSLLAGTSPGVHWAPGGRDYLRGIVFAKDDPMVGLLGQAGYVVEQSAYTPDTSVFIQFPIHTDAHRDERQVSLYEKANLAVVAQRYWSDNSVSVTLSFDAKEESEAIERVLTMHAGQLKTVSFLPMGNDTYAQMPYQRVAPEVIEECKMRLFKVDFSPIYNGDTEALEGLGEAYCTTDACLVPVK